ncbi:hypothetical protein EVA_12978 [gut metagenome]|uniref:Uncharacterized protein n=1 Tax=gut metagenome TaxID=749906 RepID=J9CFU8_9ZZZZ
MDWVPPGRLTPSTRCQQTNIRKARKRPSSSPRFPSHCSFTPDQCRIKKNSSFIRAPESVLGFSTPFERASARRISPIIFITFTPVYIFIAGITFRLTCQSAIPSQAAIPRSVFSGA